MKTDRKDRRWPLLLVVVLTWGNTLWVWTGGQRIRLYEPLVDFSTTGYIIFDVVTLLVVTALCVVVYLPKK